MDPNLIFRECFCNNIHKHFFIFNLNTATFHGWFVFSQATEKRNFCTIAMKTTNA